MKKLPLSKKKLEKVLAYMLEAEFKGEYKKGLCAVCRREFGD